MGYNSTLKETSGDFHRPNDTLMEAEARVLSISANEMAEVVVSGLQVDGILSVYQDYDVSWKLCILRDIDCELR